VATLTALITRVTERLSMVSGTGTQIYAEDRIAEMIQHKFDTLFDEAFWPQFCSWQTLTLDGTLGIVTTDLTTLLKRIDDIQVMFRVSTNTPITQLASSTINPFTLSGTTPTHYEQLGPSDTNKVSRVFQIWPKTSTGNIIVRIRTKPDDFVSTDDIDFDAQALILGSAYDYLEDDGTNPSATQKFQGMYEARVRQLKNNLSNAPISLDPVTTIPESFTFVELT